MRLLNTTTFTLKEFFGDGIPEYAILSHTWGGEEVLFRDIEEYRGRNKKSFSKVNGICDLAERCGFEWVWIDTCCIDKSSSSELSEAINSMYKWYANAHTCYVYLADVHQCISQFPSQQQQDEEDEEDEGDEEDEDEDEEDEEEEEEEATDTMNISFQETPEIIEFKNSRWFTRGWTLQELIAPKWVEFYTSDWEFFGTKNTLADIISKATGIRRLVLLGTFSMSECSVAEKMSWAAKRSTTREEDTAYCLIGLFQINMPLLYGEGQRAFIRLQDEILKNTEDYTLFAWVAQPLTQAERQYGALFRRRRDDRYYSGLLASSPVYFTNNPNAPEFASGRLQHNLLSDHRDPIPNRVLKTIGVGTTESSLAEPPVRTARGIRLCLPMIQDPDSNDLLAYIHCRERYSSHDRILCLVLRLSSRSGLTDKDGIYRRSIFEDGLRWLDCGDMKTTFTYKTVYVEGLALHDRGLFVHGVKNCETSCHIGILIFGKPDTNVGWTAAEILGKRIYAFEINHPHAKFLVELSTLAECRILLLETPEVTGDRCACTHLSPLRDLKKWSRPYRCADTVSLGKSSWINVLAKVAPKNWIDKHRDEFAREGSKVGTRNRVSLLYVWADCLLEYVGAHEFYD